MRNVYIGKNLPHVVNVPELEDVAAEGDVGVCGGIDCLDEPLEQKLGLKDPQKLSYHEKMYNNSLMRAL